jgi:hypothetical protein
MLNVLGSMRLLVWGALRLDADTLRTLQTAPDPRLLGATVLLLAGLSLALSDAAVLVINRVPRVRFVATSVALVGLSFAGAMLWVGAIRLLAAVLFGRASSADGLLLAGFAYVPLTLSVFTLIPYLGLALETLLSAWALLAMVVAVMAAFGMDLLPALSCVVPGWVLTRTAPRLFGWPLARLSGRASPRRAAPRDHVHREQSDSRARPPIRAALRHAVPGGAGR